MKKFIALFAIIMLMIGIRLNYSWLTYIDAQGRLTVYHSGGATTVYEDSRPVLMLWDDPIRLDISGGKEEAFEVLSALSAKVVKTENYENLTLIYAYSGRIRNYETLHGNKINLMIAINETGIAIGSPILKGSY